MKAAVCQAKVMELTNSQAYRVLYNRTIVEPEKKWQGKYEKFYQVYCRLYPKLEEEFSSLTRRRMNDGNGI